VERNLSSNPAIKLKKWLKIIIFVDIRNHIFSVISKMFSLCQTTYPWSLMCHDEVYDVISLIHRQLINKMIT
jgi:hypothetical protein